MRVPCRVLCCWSEWKLQTPKPPSAPDGVRGRPQSRGASTTSVDLSGLDNSSRRRNAELLCDGPQTNWSFVVAASGSQPRVGLLVIEETSLMEIWRPRVLAPF